jgi:hypothetical protein
VLVTSSSSAGSSGVARREFLAGTAAVGAVALAGCLGTGISSGTRTERYVVDPGLVLRVVADNGGVRVLGDALVDLETGNGRVHVADVAVDRDVDDRRRVVGRLGDGEHRIRARTGNGTVTLRTL